MRKKLWIGFLTALMCILCAVGLFACNSRSSVNGTYYYYKDGNSDTTSWIKLDGDEWTTSDGDSGTFEVSGNQIIIYVDIFGYKEIFSTGSVEDGVLSLTTAGITTTFCKDGSKPSSGNPSNPSNPSVKDQVTVTYNANGGKFADGNETFTQSVDKDSLLTAPTSPTRTNYTFAGWATSKSGSTMWKFDEDTASNGLTLYATWTEKSAAILSVDGASIDGDSIFMLVDNTTDAVSLSNKVVCSSDSIWRLYYDRLGQTEIPTKMAAGLSGYLSNGNNVFYIVVTSQDGTQTNLYELTVHRSYLVSVGYYNETSLLESKNVYTGSEFTANYVPTITGYTFNYWKTAAGAQATTFTVWESTRLYADKTGNQYKVTLNVNSGDALSETEKTMTYGSAFQLPVPTRTGYSFIGWYSGEKQITDATGVNILSWNIAENTTLTAKWEANTYTLTAQSNDTTMGTVTGGGNYTYDSNVTITATTKSGYTFTGWYDNSDKQVSSSLSYQFNMGLNATYTAKWILCPVVQSNNTSYGSVSSLPNTTIAGESYTVTATTKSGCTFVGWYNGNTKLTGELSYNFIMPSEVVTFTAKWIECPVSVLSSDTSLGTVSVLPETTFADEQYTVTATTSSLDYEFLGWFNGSKLLSEDYVFTFTMPSSGKVTYTAKWDATVQYIDSNGEIKYYSDCKFLTMAESQTLSGWYCLIGTVTGDFSLTIKDEAHIILADNCDWGVTGIRVSAENVLYIYAQSAGENEGKLVASANIGGDNGYRTAPGKGTDGANSGTIIINGGKITATNIGGGNGGESSRTDSGGNGGNSDIITINGGIVTATNIGGGAGASSWSANNGKRGNNGGNGGAGGTITINGGIVSAINIGGGVGATGGAGADGEFSSGKTPHGSVGGIGGNGGDGGTIIINGGSVSATQMGGGNGGTGGQGGKGNSSGGNYGSGADGGIGGTGGAGGTIIINGGEITANNIGAGNGGTGGAGGDRASSQKSNGNGGAGGDGGAGGTIIINGGEIIESEMGGKGGDGGAGGAGDLYEIGATGATGIAGEKSKIYYFGTQLEWQNLEISSGNSDIYFYSEIEPTEDGNYWHYDENGEIVIWFKED